MRITDFTLTLEVSKDKEGYSNNLYISIRDGRVNINRPYIDHSPDEAIAIESLTMRFIEDYKDFTEIVNAINKNLKLDEYAPVEEPTDAVTEGDKCELLIGVTEETKVPTSLEDTTFG